MKNVLVVIIVALMVGVGTGVSVSEGALMIDSFRDLIPLEGGEYATSVHMDIDYDLGTLDNLMIRDPDTGIDSIVGEVGIWHLGFYNQRSARRLKMFWAARR